MKTKKTNKKDTKGKARRYIKIMSCLLFFYFGIRVIMLPIIFANAPETVGGAGGFAVNIALIVFGLFAAYKLLKFRKWALIAVTVLFVLEIISKFMIHAAYGIGRLPLVSIAILILLIGGFKQLKNVK